MNFEDPNREWNKEVMYEALVRKGYIGERLEKELQDPTSPMSTLVDSVINKAITAMAVLIDVDLSNPLAYKMQCEVGACKELLNAMNNVLVEGDEAMHDLDHDSRLDIVKIASKSKKAFDA